MCFNMVRPEGFEPPAPAFVAQCSIQMSYGRMLNLAVLGGNDPHSYGVTSRRASMNTLGPKIGGDGWIRTTALFRGQIYSLVQSTTLPRLQKRVRARLQSLVSHHWEKCSGDMPLQNILLQIKLNKTTSIYNSVVFFCPIIPLFVAVKIKKLISRCF